jgi:hypothetical protein
MEKEMKMADVFTKEIPLWENSALEDIGIKEDFVATKNEILEILNKVLGENQHSFFELVLRTEGRGSTGPFVNKVFIIGKREVISCHLQKIANRIASKRKLENGTWVAGVWIGCDPFRRPKIENFI